MNILKRESYLNKIRPFVNKQLIKVLTGQRRVGKSYLLQQICDEIKIADPSANIIFINLEKVEFSHITNFIELSNYISSKSVPRKNY